MENCLFGTCKLHLIRGLWFSVILCMSFELCYCKIYQKLPQNRFRGMCNVSFSTLTDRLLQTAGWLYFFPLKVKSAKFVTSSTWIWQRKQSSYSSNFFILMGCLNDYCHSITNTVCVCACGLAQWCLIISGFPFFANLWFKSIWRWQRKMQEKWKIKMFESQMGYS